jgi:hypothetical protein
VCPVVAHVEGVEKLLAGVQAAEPGRAGEHGSVGRVFPLDRAADVGRVGELEEAQVRAIPASERGVDRVAQREERVRPRGGEHPTRARPERPPAALDEFDADR